MVENTENSKCRLQVVIVSSKEPELYSAILILNKSYPGSELLKEGLRCLARREGLLVPSINIKEAAFG